ncbi:MAG: hypothetical protein ACYC44_00905 [Patescibacteria group bacterium]
MSNSSDSQSKAILGEPHGNQEEDRTLDNTLANRPEIGELLQADLKKNGLIALYGLSHQARKFMFLRLGIGSGIPLTLSKTAAVLSLSLDQAAELEDDALIKLEETLDAQKLLSIQVDMPANPTASTQETEHKEDLAEAEEEPITKEDIEEALDPQPPQDALCDKELGRLLKRIPAFPAYVLRKRLGLGSKPMSMDEITESLGNKPETVRILYMRGIDALSQFLTPEAIQRLEAKMTNPTTDNAQPAATPDAGKVMSLEEIQAAMAQQPTRPVNQDEACEPTPPAQAVQPVVESPAEPAPAKPEVPAPPTNEARIQELEQSMTELQKSVRRLVTKNRELQTRVEVLEHEGEEQDQKIREFLGELDRREVLRMNAFTKAVDGLHAEVAQLVLIKLPTDPPPPAKSAEVIPIGDANKHRAGPDGFFLADGSSWGLVPSLARRLGIDEPTLKSRLASGKARSRKGLDCHGTAMTFYSWLDALRICSDLITIVPQNGYGQVRIKGQTHVTQHQLTKMMRTTPGSLLQRIDPSVRSCLSRCPTGVYLYYRVSDVKRVCADILSKPRNSTPRQAQRAK